jgi:hypothetical protein
MWLDPIFSQKMLTEIEVLQSFRVLHCLLCKAQGAKELKIVMETQLPQSSKVIRRVQNENLKRKRPRGGGGGGNVKKKANKL